MEKSQFLDELRMEVGLVADYANNLSEFYEGIVQAFGQKLTDEEYAVALFKTKDLSFQLVSHYGEISEEETEKFGEGPLSLCAIRSRTISDAKNKRNRLISPFYNGHHLTGVLMVEFPCGEYLITNDDYVFMNEVCRYIEVNQRCYSDFSEKC